MVLDLPVSGSLQASIKRHKAGCDLEPAREEEDRETLKYMVQGYQVLNAEKPSLLDGQEGWLVFNAQPTGTVISR